MVDHEFDAIFIVACIAAFFLSMGIGANDVSNSLGVTVASGIISINKAMLIASVFEFLGAVTLGRGVSRTVLSIVDNACFESTPQRYGVGLVSVIMGAGGWLVIATRTGLPVSATHSTIGAMLGFGLVSTGYACIQWVTLLPVVLGWIFSPAIAAGAALGLYYILNSVFRSPEDHVLIRNRGKKALYILIWISLFAFTLTLSIGVLGWWQALLLSVGAGSVALLVFVCCIYPSLRAYIFRTMSTKVFDQHGRLVDVPPEIELRVIERDDDELEPRSQNGGHMGGGKHIRGDNVAAGASATVNPTQAEWYHTPQPPARIGTDYRDYEPESYEEEGRLVVLDNPLQRHLARQMDVFDYLDPVETEYECADCHSRQLYKVGTAKVMIIKNKIDALWELKESGMPLRSRVAVIKLKRMFGHVQILTTTIKSFAHGSNDVSNSIAPLAGIYVLYTSGAVGDPTTEGLPLWLLAIGGCGISVGLFFGRRVIKTVGAEIAPLTPKLATGLLVLLASRLGLPLSATHSQIGAVVGLGLAEGVEYVRFDTLWVIVRSWVVTFPATLAMTMVFYALLMPLLAP